MNWRRRQVLRRTLLARAAAAALTLAMLQQATVFSADSGKQESQWIAVTAPAFRVALTPLIEHRRAEGFKVTVEESTRILSQEQIRQTNGQLLQIWLHRLYREHPGPSYVVLVGAVTATDPAIAAETVVPPLLGTAGRMKGQFSDHGYGSPDTNDAATVAVGRFPARSLEQVRAMVEKTLRLESDRRPATWRNRIVLLTGNPGGGPMTEMLVEEVARSRFNQLHPIWNVQALFHSSLSRYYLPSTLLHDTATRLLEEGEFLSLYLGHSGAAGLWSQRTNFLTREDWSRLNIPRGPGVFFTGGCYSCQLAGKDGEGFGLAALRNPAGPAAVIGAHGESYSAAGLLALDGLMRCFCAPPFPARLADCWLAVQAGLARGEIEDETFKIFDQFDGSGGKVPLETQRREHLEMWMLLGDPALRLPTVPLDLRLDVSGPVSAGQRLTVKGLAPERVKDGTARVTLERLLTSAPAGLEKLPPSTPETREARERTAKANHARANLFVLADAETRLRGTRFECTLTVPAKLNWTNLVVRAYAATETGEALGAVALPVNQ